jgi:hypothetical protein
MKRFITTLLDILYQSNSNMLELLNSICIYVNYFFSIRDSEQLYSLDNFISYSNTFTNSFKLYIVNIDEFKNIQDVFFNCDIPVNVFEEKTIIEIICECLREDKKLKSLLKESELENYLHMIQINNEIAKIVSDKYNTIINLFSNMGDFYGCLKNIKYNKIQFYENDILLNNLCFLNCLISHKVNIKNSIINSEVIQGKTVDSKGDLIICNIPNNFKNIIYANCCNPIKQLKIRGTKAEPLILQLILQITNKKGDIMLITPNSLLFSESNQHVETRKYLIENYNIKKIIELENKKSLLFITNDGRTQNIEVKKNDKTMVVSINSINKENYSLYFNFNNEVKNPIFETTKLGEIINIFPKNDKEYSNILFTSKFNDLTIGDVNQNCDYNYVFVTKSDNIFLQEFLNIYLLQFLKKQIELITKGKMQKIVPELINNLEINLIPIETQKTITAHYNLNETTIKNNNIQIDNFNKIKKDFIDNMIHGHVTKKLSSLMNVNISLNENSYISIKKNSLTAGSVELITNKDLYINNTNYFYIEFSESDKLYYYYILKHLQKDIIEQTTKNKSIGLSKSYLENLEIPILEFSEREHLIYVSKFFDDQIQSLEDINNKLNENNLISLLF